VAAGDDSAALRVTAAALAAIAVLLGVLLWQSADAALRARAEEARAEAERVDVLAAARAVESASDLESGARSAAAALRGGGAVAVYAPDGRRAAIAAAAGSEALAVALPETAPAVVPAGPVPARVAAGAGGARLVAVRLAGDRALVVASPPRAVAAWGSTIAAYQALTLVVVLVAVVFVLRRAGRAARARLDTSASPARGPAREAEFVVETFQSVIGELQNKERQLELLSRRERERADRSERFSERVIAQMPTGLVVVDRAGRVTAANPGARDLFPDLPRERTEAIAYETAFAAAPDLVRMVAECLRDGTSFQGREVDVRGGDGLLAGRCLGVSVSPIMPPDGAPEAALCLATDLTEVAGLRERVRIQETMANLGEMAAGLTHELKNSLAVIQGFAQLIAAEAPELAGEPAEALIDEVGQLSQMVTDFLNFARPHEVAFVPVDLGDVVASVAERFSERCAALEISCEVDAEPDALVLGDETLLSRAILNLVQNAVDALEDAPAPRRLRLAVRRAGGEVAVEVADSGPGVPPEDLPKIFIPFFTTRSRGHGIGLALTQKIVLSHGGRILVENAGPGAVFRCLLPAAGR
jgi:signal transduction histidine kinase